MASRELVLVCLDVASDLFRGVFVHEPDGTFVGSGTVGCGGRGGLFKHGGADRVFGMMWCGINFGFVAFVDDGVLDGRERTLQLTLLPLDSKVLLQDGGQVRSHSGVKGIAARTTCFVRIGEGGQLVSDLSALADKDG